MSDLITHWLVYEDVHRIARRLPEMKGIADEVLHRHAEPARLGAITRFGGKWVPEILTRTRDALAAGQALDETAERRLAFAFGGIAHAPADIMVKPLLKKYAAPEIPSNDHSPGGKREVSAYYDVVAFLETHGEGGLFDERFFTSAGQPLTALVRTLFHQALLASHTINPGREQPVEFIDRFLAHLQPLYIELSLYERVLAELSASNAVGKYGMYDEFYRREDAILEIARSLQRGGSCDPPRIKDALGEGRNRSAYGRAVAMGVRWFCQASEYLGGRCDTPPDVSQG